MNNPDLKKLQRLLIKIPRGRVSTYGALAVAMKMPKASRYVGYLLGSNPEPDSYPCYKIVRSDGSVGGYSGPGGPAEKISRLRRDGFKIKRGKIENFQHSVFNFQVRCS